MSIPQRVRDIELPQFDLLNDLAADWRGERRRRHHARAGAAGIRSAACGRRRAAPRARRSRRRTSIHRTPASPNCAARWPRRWRRSAPTVDPDREIIITAGGNQAFQLALTTLVDPGDEVDSRVAVLPESRDGGAFRRRRADRSADRGRAGVRRRTWEDIAPHLSPRTRAVVLVSPSNPDRRGRDRRRTAAHRATSAPRANVVGLRRRDVSPFQSTTARQPRPRRLPKWRDNVVVIGSFSKAFADHRLAMRLSAWPTPRSSPKR